MSKHEPLYLREFAELVGLDENRWDVAISKKKGSGGRKVIVWIRDKTTGLHLVVMQLKDKSPRNNSIETRSGLRTNLRNGF
jgi:hypothetical protein